MCVFVGVCVGVGVCVSVCYQCDQQFCSADLSHKSLGLLLPIDLATLPDTHIHKHTHTHTHTPSHCLPTRSDMSSIQMVWRDEEREKQSGLISTNNSLRPDSSSSSCLSSSSSYFYLSFSFSFSTFLSSSSTFLSSSSTFLSSPSCLSFSSFAFFVLDL